MSAAFLRELAELREKVEAQAEELRRLAERLAAIETKRQRKQVNG